MLGIGMGEMLLIGAIALIVIGPDKFPDFAKIALRTVRDLRGYMDDIQNEVSKELKPIKRELDKVTYESNKYMNELSKEVSSTTTTVSAAQPAASTGKYQSDPTDRQDDSFNYSGGSDEHPDAPVYNSQDEPAREETPSRQEEDSLPVAEPAEDVVEGSDAQGDAEPFDLPEAPVERMD